MKLIFILLFLLFFVPLASASLIEIEIKMKTEGNFSAFFTNSSQGIFEVDPEFYNTGSVAYQARARLNVFNSTNLIFTGWSSEETLMPGERKSFEIYWYSQDTLANLTARVRMYYGREVIDREVQFSIESSKNQEDAFQIKNFRTYDDYIRFEIKSSKDLSKVIVIPTNYMDGWIFEQAKIEDVKQGKNVEVRINYDPMVWISPKVGIEAVSGDGGYQSIRQFSLEKEAGLMKYFHYLTDRLSLILNL